MTGTRISEMTLKPALAAGDLVPIISGGQNFGFDLGALANFVSLPLSNDITVDNYSTIQTAINAMGLTGGEIALPSGWFRVSQRLKIPRTITLRGVGAGTRRIVYGETPTPPGYQSYTGTVLVFDQNVAGIYCPTQTEVTDTNTVVANEGASGSNATYWQYSGADQSRIEGMVLFSKGYTGTPTGDKHGIEARDVVHLKDMIVVGFPGHGVYLTGSADVSDGTGSKYGSVDKATLTNIWATQNMVCGFRIEGRDANVISLISCNASLNGSWGFDDASELGNAYFGCHAATNNRNATIVDHTDVRWISFKADSNVSVGSYRADPYYIAPHVYVGCYIEGGNGNLTSLNKNCIVLGGLMAAGADTGTNGIPVSFSGSLMQQAGLRHYNTRGTVTVSVGFGREDTRMSALSWGSLDVNADLQTGSFSHELIYYSTPKIWSIEQPAASATGMIAFPTALTDAYSAPYLQNGFHFGSPNTTVNRRVTAVAGTTAPDGIYRQGDIIYTTATAGGNIGLVCVTAGAQGAAWITGHNYFPNTWQNLADIVSNASKVYRCITKGGGTTSVAPTHSSGTVTGADGYAWQYLNATSVPVFKTFGAIAA